MIKTDNQFTKVAVLQEQMGQVNENIQTIKDDIREIKEKLDDNYLKKIDADKLLVDAEKIHVDHEQRLRKVEIWGAIAVGILYALQFYFQFIK